MNQSNFHAVVLGLTLDRTDRTPLHGQLAAHLRRLILSGTAPPGTRLPSSRVLAGELSVSRATVVSALDQLVSEGYAEGRRGAGLFVAADLPDPMPHADGPPAPAVAPAGPTAPPRPFQSAAPDMTLFPHRAWARLLERAWRDPGPELLHGADPCGHPALRTAIAAHLRDWRGFACPPSRVIVTAGLADALALLGEAALTPGETVLVETPGHAPLRRALAGAGLVPRAVPVDAQGFDIAAGLARDPDAAAVVVTPTRHFPLGMTLPVARRLALLDWAQRTGGLIVEDDYDSEYRYRGAPLPALAGLEPPEGAHVAYVGTFSKVMTPALRLGFLLAPTRLMPALTEALRRAGPRAALVAQPALARFIETGAFAAHIRRMRRVQAGRQTALLSALARHLDDLLTVTLPPAGMHVVADLAPALAARLSDRQAAERAAKSGVSAQPLSAYHAPDAPDDPAARRQGLILGYAAFDAVALDAAAQRLAEALRA